MTENVDLRNLTDREINTLLKPARSNKWRNQKAEYEGERFDSQWELTHYLDLRLRERAGQIRNLKRQQWLTVQEEFVYHGEHGPLIVRAIRLCIDFQYEEPSSFNPDYWFIVYDDAKGKITPEYALKWKLLMHYFRDNPGVILRLSYKDGR